MSMTCPKCQAKPSKVLDSRPTINATWRRHLCPNGHRFSTEERVVWRDADLNKIRTEFLAASEAAISQLIKGVR